MPLKAALPEDISSKYSPDFRWIQATFDTTDGLLGSEHHQLLNTNLNKPQTRRSQKKKKIKQTNKKQQQKTKEREREKLPLVTTGKV